MTEIYEEIAKLSDKFTEMAYGITTDKNKIDNAVQELMLYFLQMNPDTLRSIYVKDGIEYLITASRINGVNVRLKPSCSSNEALFSFI